MCFMILKRSDVTTKMNKEPKMMKKNDENDEPFEKKSKTK